MLIQSESIDLDTPTGKMRTYIHRPTKPGNFPVILFSFLPFSSIVQETHLNSGKIAHGGYLSTIADTGMGTAAHLVSNKKCVTISLDVKFISAGLLNQTLNGKIKIQKKTKSLVFISCEIFNSEGVVITASGIWKIL